MRSHRYSTTSRSCEMNSIVRPKRSRRSLEQVDHLRLDRHVERRYRLVGDDEARLDRQRAGDADALALPAREFVRVAARVLGREADERQQLGDPCGARRSRVQAVRRQRLGERVADPPARIQARVRVLEDDLQAPPIGPHRPRRQGHEIDAFEPDRAGARLDQLQHRTADRALARSRFADQPEHLARRDVEADVVDRADRTVAPAEVLLQALHAQHRLAHSSLQRRQRERRPAAMSASGGIAVEHSGKARAQRGAKAQPGSGSSGLATWPAIAFRRRFGPARRAVEGTARQAGEQASRVRMARRPEQRSHVGLLDHPAGVHDDDPVGDLGDDAEVVGDEQDGHADVAPQLVEQRQDLRLDGDVEGGRRLVGDQQQGVAGERDRDHHPLPHAARQLMRILAEALLRGRDLDQLEHLERAPRARQPASCPGAGPRLRRSGRRR